MIPFLFLLILIFSYSTKPALRFSRSLETISLRIAHDLLFSMIWHFTIYLPVITFWELWTPFKLSTEHKIYILSKKTCYFLLLSISSFGVEKYMHRVNFGRYRKPLLFFYGWHVITGKRILDVRVLSHNSHMQFMRKEFTHKSSVFSAWLSARWFLSGPCKPVSIGNNHVVKQLFVSNYGTIRAFEGAWRKRLVNVIRYSCSLINPISNWC